jgi:hypothetical protein
VPTQADIFPNEVDDVGEIYEEVNGPAAILSTTKSPDASPQGIVIFNSVAFTNSITMFVTPIDTVDAFVKPVPVIVTTVPAVPDEGVKVVIVGFISPLVGL